MITEKIIEKSSNKVWQTFTNFKDFPSWNPFIKRLWGKAKEGTFAIVFDYYFKHIYLPNFVKIYKSKEPNEICWRGGLVLLPKFLFHGDHQFLIVENNQGVSTFIHKCQLTGIFPKIFKIHIQSSIKRSQEEMMVKLRELVLEKSL